VGQLDGKDIFDVDLESIEDKPWRKPGADITDYFNFGFNEQSWRAYCMKQKQMREELLMQKRIQTFEHQPDFSRMAPPDAFMMGQFGMPPPPPPNMMMRPGKRPREQDDSVIQVVASNNDPSVDGMG
jgi:pre-mRNA 3'-end-processing factor FIP1